MPFPNTDIKHFVLLFERTLLAWLPVHLALSGYLKERQLEDFVFCLETFYDRNINISLHFNAFHT